MSNAPGRLEGAQRFEKPAEGQKALQSLRQRIQSLTAAVTLAVAQLMAADTAEAKNPIGPVSAPVVQKFNANDYIADFPRDLEGVACYHEDLQPIDKNKDSMAVIYVRQMHRAPNLNVKKVREVEACQREIETLLKDIVGRGIADEVFYEGCTEHWHPTNVTLMKFIDKQEMPYIRDEAFWGAPHLLRKEGLLRILPGEKRTIHEIAKDVFDDPDATPEEFNEWIFERREDWLLDSARKLGKKVVVTVYGADHSFANNIRKRKNISSLTLTPESVLKEHGPLPWTHYWDLPMDDPNDAVTYPTRPEHAPALAWK